MEGVGSSNLKMPKSAATSQELSGSNAIGLPALRAVHELFGVSGEAFQRLYCILDFGNTLNGLAIRGSDAHVLAEGEEAEVEELCRQEEREWYRVLWRPR